MRATQLLEKVYSASIWNDFRYYFTTHCSVYCRRTKTQRTWWHAELRHSLCGCNKTQKENTTVECMKTGFSPSKVGGIACCDHKMSSASSLSPYQAVCCTEHSPLALGAGHTSWHPSPRRLSFSLSSLSLSVSLSLWLSFTRLQWPTLPSHPSPTPPLPVTLRGSALPWCQCRGLSVDKAAGLQKTHQTLSLLCAVSELSAQQKDRDSSFSLRPLLVSTTWLQTAKGPRGCCTYRKLKPFKRRSMFSDCCDDSVVIDDCKYKA